MVNNYHNPCDKCGVSNCSSYRNCSDYLKYVRTIWKQFNGYPARMYLKEQKAEQKKEDSKFRYEHPDIIRRYLENGPCAACKRGKVCEVPCSAYWHWWDARMEWYRRKLGL